MNCYRELLMDYEGKSFDNNSVNSDIFFGLRTISMLIASGNLNDAYEYTQNLFYDNLFNSDYFYSNLRDGDSYSNVCDYCFKPIFSGRKFRALLSHGEFVYSKECHNITSAYLKYFGAKKDNISAVTALTRGVNSKIFFHSFILDSDTNMVYDFANNIIMPKDKYYDLIVVREINDINYKNYVLELKKYSTDEKEGLADLLFLSLVELKNNKRIKFN